MANVAQLGEFDEIIDVRTPSEFAEDHVPGAVNRAVLDDAERARVGTLYKQVSAFTGRKVGAALVSRNIAQHIETGLIDKPKAWRPLIYCWLGGKRSEAMVHILREIGWDADRLEGGYRGYRRAVIAELPQLARRYTLCVVCGLTGSGKSRLLQTLSGLGAQVLDLERLAAHRGSVLGNLPDEPQPASDVRVASGGGGASATKRLLGVGKQAHAPCRCPMTSWPRCGRRVRAVDTIAARARLLMEQYPHLSRTPLSWDGSPTAWSSCTDALQLALKALAQQSGVAGAGARAPSTTTIPRTHAQSPRITPAWHARARSRSQVATKPASVQPQEP
jgi:rhodanese-related sulfurtransferase